MLHPALARERVAVVALFRRAADNLRQLIARLADTPDTEALHDVRVELRRLRSVLATLAGMPAVDTEALGEHCRWLASCGGSLRDFDVLLEALPTYAENCGLDSPAELSTLRRVLSKQRTAQRRKLRAAIRSRRAEIFLAQVERLACLSPQAPGWSARPAAAAALRRAHRRIVKQGKRLAESADAAELHKLRKRCKRLRYLLEVYAPLFPGRRIEAAINRLRKLQNALGRFQDCTVQAELLRGVRASLAADGRDARSIDIIDRFLTMLDEQAKLAAERSAQRFAEFTDRKLHRRVRKLYAAHAAELGNPVPEQPLLFIKPPSSAVDCGPQLRIPSERGAVHHELEIAILIGTEITHASAEEARAAIAGIGLGIDVTLRDLQDALKKKSHPWELAKGFDGAAALSGFAPLTDEQDLENLQLRLSVNGRRRQVGNSAQMLMPIIALICHASAQFSLWPGDVVLTGTPSGVGPLLVGDRISAELRGVLRLRSQVIA
jgi:2-keto-4-pentenoate hydratase/2-oxohepta-3-ene-1,7-dioic acid hydratase in catechol pathway